MAKPKVRLMFIRRTVEIEVPTKDGKTEMKKVERTFPCAVNAGVPFSHRMCE